MDSLEAQLNTVQEQLLREKGKVSQLERQLGIEGDKKATQREPNEELTQERFKQLLC